VLLGFGAAGALTPSGPAGRASASGPAGLAGADAGSAAAQPAGSGARAAGASGHDAARPWASASIPDGIHYTPAGYAARAHLIAAALARAFPRSGSSAGCVVH
jgi:lysophospholipase L1-like esterase